MEQKFFGSFFQKKNCFLAAPMCRSLRGLVLAHGQRGTRVAAAVYETIPMPETSRKEAVLF
jgi:hypothetical protein